MVLALYCTIWSSLETGLETRNKRALLARLTPLLEVFQLSSIASYPKSGPGLGQSSENAASVLRIRAGQGNGDSKYCVVLN